MGEVADMMLDGTLCQCCGNLLERSDGDFPQICSDCEREYKKNQKNIKNQKQGTSNNAV